MSRKVPKLISQMMEPGFYAHPVQMPIRLVQTHISWVLLTGPYAYKIKKPVDFGFLDFSTIEKRGHFCHEELRLNRHFAPDIYLEVLQITKNAEGNWQFSQDSSVEEFVLKMREFPQNCLWSSLFEAGRLTTQLMQELGRKLALIHQTCPNPEDIAHFGDLEAVRAVVEENYQASLPFLNSLQTREQLEQTRAFTDRFFKTHGELIQYRRDHGYIRECHGDLHLNNLCMMDNSIHIFDCIEFNQEFRCIDPVYDVAFLLVDLEIRSRRDLAWAFFNAWLEWSGDYRGACLMPLYCSMRAYVRAKVYSFQTVDLAMDDSARELAGKKAGDFYRLAWQYSQGQPGRIWVVHGLSGAGKSTVARFMARELGGVHIRSDALRKHIAGIDLDKSGPASLYTPPLSQEVYRQLADLGVALAREGNQVVLDACYGQNQQRAQLLTKAEEAGLPVNFIHCQAPKGILKSRVASRKSDISDATPDLIDVQLEKREFLAPDEGSCQFEIDTSQDWIPRLNTILAPYQNQQHHVESVSR